MHFLRRTYNADSYSLPFLFSIRSRESFLSFFFFQFFNVPLKKIVPRKIKKKNNSQGNGRIGRSIAAKDKMATIFHFRFRCALQKNRALFDEKFSWQEIHGHKLN